MCLPKLVLPVKVSLRLYGHSLNHDSLVLEHVFVFKKHQNFALSKVTRATVEWAKPDKLTDRARTRYRRSQEKLLLGLQVKMHVGTCTHRQKSEGER